MKYFTSKWYNDKQKSKGTELYYSYIKEHYDYYPKWIKDLDILNKMIFDYTLISEVVISGNDINIRMVGINGVNKPFWLRFINASIEESPEEVEGQDIVAEEIYYTENSAEFHFLVIDDVTLETSNFTIKCKKAELEFDKQTIFNKISDKLFDFKLYLRNKIH